VLPAYRHLPFKEPEPALPAPSPASAWKFNPEFMQDIHQGGTVIHPDNFPQRMQPDQMFLHKTELPGTINDTLCAEDPNPCRQASFPEFFSKTSRNQRISYF
jgi:hypothetical protein